MQILVDVSYIFLFYIVITIVGTIITALVLAYYKVLTHKTRMSHAVMSVFRDVMTVIIVTLIFGCIGVSAILAKDYLAVQYFPGFGELLAVICFTIIIIFIILYLWLRRKQRRGGKFHWRESGMTYSPWG